MTAFTGSIPRDHHAADTRPGARPGESPWARRVDGAEGQAGPADDAAARGRSVWGDRSQGIDPATRQRLVRRLEKMAWLLDTSLGIPGTRFRLGLDAGLGLIPVVGDVVSALLSMYIIFTAWRLGARWPILALMVLNVLLDVLAGVVPVVGDVADVFVKANVRNIRLLGLTARW